jgi:hypothetical protein
MAAHPLIKLGSSGPDVTEWQKLLDAQGFTVAPTGKFDAATDTATRQWQKAKGLDPDGKVGAQSWAMMLGEAPPKTFNPSYGNKAQFGRDVLLKVWPKILEEAAQSEHAAVRELGAMERNLAELQIVQAMAHLESTYGLSPYTNQLTGEKAVLNNWGAVQAGKAPCDPATAFEVTDTGAGGKYNACYKRYATPEDGAVDFLRHLTIKRPTSWARAKEGDIDGYSVQMHSWTPPLEQLGAGHAGKVQNKDPITGTLGYFEQPPLAGKNSRAKGLEERIWAIAAALGESIAAQRGGPMPEPAPSDSDDAPTPVARSWLGAVALALVAAGIYLVVRGVRIWGST